MIRPYHGITFGTDPEGFFASTKTGKIVGAERVIPTTGLKKGMYSKVVLDGVQFEMHPAASSEITGLGLRISACFLGIAERLRQLNGEFRLDFSQVVNMDKKELSSLSEAARKLGCMPSQNWYRAHPIDVPVDFPMRSAAGHLHLGLLSSKLYNPSPMYSTKPMDYRRNLVPLLDVFVGNTCVLIDRDPAARKRRTLYGHAGEFRLPSHGLEYRTTSNFWLKHFGLMELVFGLAYTAISVFETTIYGEENKTGFDPEDILAKSIDLKKVERAIEKNDAKLAYENWLKVREFIVAHVQYDLNFPIHQKNIDMVDTFIKLACNDELKPFLPTDPADHWVTLGNHHIDYNGYTTSKLVGNVRWADLLKSVNPEPTPEVVP